TGLITGATWTGAGRFGSALFFDGGNASVTVADSPSLRLTNAMTLEAWVHPLSTATNWRDVIYKGDDLFYLMGGSPGGTPGVGGTFARPTLPGPSALPINVWS